MSIAAAILLVAGILLIVVPMASAATLGFSGPQYSNGTPSITVSNRGPFEVYGLTVRASVLSPGGLVLASGSSAPVDIPPGSTATVSVPIAPNSSSIAEVQPLSLGYVTVDVEAGANLAGILPARLGASFPMNVSEAVERVSVRPPSIVSASNGSLVILENASFFYNVPFVPLSGVLEVRVMNGTSQVGYGSQAVSASPGQEVEISIPVNLSISPYALLTRAQQFNVSAYLVSGGTSYPLGGELYSWSPPVQGLTVGPAAVSPINGSFYAAALPISFVDGQASGFPLSIVGYLYSNGTAPVSEASWTGRASPGSNSIRLEFTAPSSAAPRYAVIYLTAFNSTITEEVNLG